jgi:hypothetical protein
VRPTLASNENMEILKRKLAVMLTLAYNCLSRATILLVRKAIVASAPAGVSSDVLTEARTDFARKILLKQLSGTALCLASGQDRLVATSERRSFYANVMALKEQVHFPVDITEEGFIMCMDPYESLQGRSVLLCLPPFFPLLCYYQMTPVMPRTRSLPPYMARTLLRSVKLIQL